MKYGIRPHFLISLHCLKKFQETEREHLLHQNKATERRQIQLVLPCQKYWSNSIFHFIFLQKVSFTTLEAKYDAIFSPCNMGIFFCFLY